MPQAAHAVEELTRVSPDRGPDAVFAVGILVACKKQAMTDPRLSDADRHSKARDFTDRAAALLTMRPSSAADDPNALNGLAWLLATCSDPQLRDPARAVELARKAVGTGAEGGCDLEHARRGRVSRRGVG